jgi:pyrimidine oxygenase
MTGHASMDQSSEDANSLNKTLLGNDNFMLWEVIKGDPKSVAEQIREISSVDAVGGVMFTFQDYLMDIDRFGRDVMPLLR